MTGYVYAAENGDGHIKIGYSASPRDRLAFLQCGSPTTCKLIGYVAGTLDHEREIHELCAPDHIRGEWFRRGKRVELFISQLPPLPTRLVGLRKISAASSHALTQFRRRRGLSLEAFGALVGVSKGTVHKWESGRLPRSPYLARIKAVTDGEVTADDFVAEVAA